MYTFGRFKLYGQIWKWLFFGFVLCVFLYNKVNFISFHLVWSIPQSIGQIVVDLVQTWMFSITIVRIGQTRANSIKSKQYTHCDRECTANTKMIEIEQNDDDLKQISRTISSLLERLLQRIKYQKRRKFVELVIISTEFYFYLWYPIQFLIN